MGDTEQEKFYDEEIAPALADLAKKCRDRGVSFLAVAEWEPGEIGRTITTSDDTGPAIIEMNNMVQVNGNFERYCFSYMRKIIQNKTPHSSICLAKLGIDPDPAERNRLC